MAKYQQYEEYKDSKIESLGMLPSHWVVKSLSKATKRISVGLATSVTEYYRDEGIPIIRNMNIKEGYFDGSDMLYLDPKFAKANSGKVVFKGDVIAVHTGSNLGLACIVPDEFNNCHTFTTLIVTTHKYLLNRYLTYCINSAYGKAEVNRLKFGFGKDNLNVKEFNFFYTILPEFDEQLKIANFLDHETARIDTLIEKQQTLIQLLKEKRQAVISHAVTKGLNPDAPMKDSGVEWLGGIPSHWNMQKLKYVGEAKNGLTYSPDNVTEAGIGTLVLRSSNIQNAQLAFEDNVYVDMKIPERILVKTDDILICSRNGSRRLIGKNALITEDVAGQAFGAFMVVFRSEINTYLYWILNSPLFEYQSGSFLTSTINQLTIGNLHSMEVPIPPKKEQDEIEKYLKNKMIDFDKLISKAEQAIHLMQERRTALISAAVTGKVDVRGWRAAE